jgi:WD40 repeat protein
MQTLARLWQYRLLWLAFVALAVTFWGLEALSRLPEPLHSWKVEDIAVTNRRLLADDRTLVVMSMHNTAKTPGMFAYRTQGPLRFWDTLTGRELRQAEVPQLCVTPQQQAFQDLRLTASQDGRWLAVQDILGHLFLYDTATAQRRHTLQTSADQGWSSAIYDNFRFSPDSRYLAYEQPDRKAVLLWDLREGRQHAALVGACRGMEFSPHGQLLVTNTPDSSVLKLWEVATGQERAKLEGHTYPPRSLCFTPDSQRLTTGLNQFRPRQSTPPTTEIILWETTHGQRLATLPIDNTKFDNLHTLAFANEGKLLLASNHVDQNFLWDVSVLPPRERHDLFCENLKQPKGKKRIDYRQIPIFSHDGKWLVMGEEQEGVVQLRDTATLTLQQRITIPGARSYCWFAKNNRYLLARVEDNVPNYPPGWRGWWDRLLQKPSGQRRTEETRLYELPSGRHLLTVPGSAAGLTAEGPFLLTYEPASNARLTQSTGTFHRWAIPQGWPLSWWLFSSAGLLWFLTLILWWRQRRSSVGGETNRPATPAAATPPTPSPLSPLPSHSP